MEAAECSITTNPVAAAQFNGIDINGGSEDGFLYNNTVYGVENDCASIEQNGDGASDGWTVVNNIFDASANTQVNRGNNSRFAFTVHSLVTSWTDNNNLHWDNDNGAGVGDDDSSLIYTIIGPVFDTYTMTQWNTATYGTNSDWADPLFTNPATPDFTLQAGSPAKNTGVDVGLDSDILGNPIVGLPDMGAYEVQ